MCDCVSSEEFFELYNIFEDFKFWVNGLSVEGQKIIRHEGE